MLSKRTGLSVSWLSDIERGLGKRVSLETWIAIGAAIDRPVRVAFSRPLGVVDPRDSGHLEIQEYLLSLGRTTGRTGTFELPTKPLDPSRSTDVGLLNRINHIRILAECWNTFGDLGAAVRQTNRKQAEATAAWPQDRIATVWVVRDSAANRAILGRYPHIIDAAFPGSSRAWVHALVAGTPPPTEPGLVWYDAGIGRLLERRRATIPA